MLVKVLLCIKLQVIPLGGVHRQRGSKDCLLGSHDVGYILVRLLLGIFSLVVILESFLEHVLQVFCTLGVGPATRVGAHKHIIRVLLIIGHCITQLCGIHEHSLHCIVSLYQSIVLLQSKFIQVECLVALYYLIQLQCLLTHFLKL